MHAKNQIHVSFLIVNYKSLAELEIALRDLNTVIPEKACEILIANNDPVALPNSIKKIIPKAAHIGIHNFPENRGFGAANNQIARVAIGKYLYFLNPDTYAFTGNYRDLIQVIESKVCDVVAPMILNADGSPQMWAFGEMITPKQIVLNNLHAKKTPINDNFDIRNNQNVKIVDWVTGAAFLMKKNDFIEIGGFDENYFLYFEDIDLCKRLADQGKKIGVSNNMRLKHTSGASASSKVVQKKNYYAAQSYFLKKHYGKVTEKIFSLMRAITHPSC